MAEKTNEQGTHVQGGNDDMEFDYKTYLVRYLKSPFVYAQSEGDFGAVLCPSPTTKKTKEKTLFWCDKNFISPSSSPYNPTFPPLPLISLSKKNRSSITVISGHAKQNNTAYNLAWSCNKTNARSPENHAGRPTCKSKSAP